MNVSELQIKARQLRLDTLTAIHKSGVGRSGSCMSVMDILVALYYGGVMKFDPAIPGSGDSDHLILSKGHAAMAQYAILADLGFFDQSELDFAGREGAMLKSFPYHKVPGVSVTNFSHGEGLAMALGVALGLRMDKKDNKVFAVIGDGELQGGQVWEALTVAAHHHLNNLIVFVDDNKMQASGPVKGVLDLASIRAKFDAFGWKVIPVVNGHDYDQILDAVYRSYTTMRQPVCIWCHTVVGKGVEFAEGKASYKDTVFSEDELKEITLKLQV